MTVVESSQESGHGKAGTLVWVRVGSIESRVESGHESDRVDLYFSNNFFFFLEIDAICQLFMNSLTVIKFSLVILLPITTKHLT